MIEKFSDTLGGFLSEEGEFVFTIVDYELKDSSKGNPMAVFNVKSEAGTSTIYHTITAKSKWSYANLVRACFKLDTKEKIENFHPHGDGIDYELIGQDLVGKKFLGVVECQEYIKEVKKPNDDGTFTTDNEVKETYKIVEYKIAK